MMLCSELSVYYIVYPQLIVKYELMYSTRNKTKWSSRYYNCLFNIRRTIRLLTVRQMFFSFICMFCRSLFVLLCFFFLPLCCLFFFDLRILITLLVSSNSSSPSRLEVYQRIHFYKTINEFLSRRNEMFNVVTKVLVSRT